MRVIFALMLMLALNMFLFLGQTAVTEVAADEGITGVNFFDPAGSPIGDFDKGNYTLESDVSESLPTGDAQITTDDANTFTDSFLSIKNWFLNTDVGKGATYLFGMVNAVPNFLKSIGLPVAVSFALGFFWHALTLFLIVAFIKGNY